METRPTLLLLVGYHNWKFWSGKEVEFDLSYLQINPQHPERNECV